MGTRRRTRSFGVIGVFALLTTAAAHAESKSETSGFALGGGLGYQTPAIGVEALAYLQPGTGFRVAPYVGVGVFPVSGVTKTGAAGGVMAIFGHKHRGFIDLNYGLGAVAVAKRVDTGAVVNSETYYGVTLAGGYEYMSDGGFFVHPGIGVTHFDRTTPIHSQQNVVTLGVALGYKF